MHICIGMSFLLKLFNKQGKHTLQGELTHNTSNETYTHLHVVKTQTLYNYKLTIYMCVLKENAKILNLMI